MRISKGLFWFRGREVPPEWEAYSQIEIRINSKSELDGLEKERKWVFQWKV